MKKLHHYRLRRFFKWTGLFASLLILGLWVWSTIPSASGVPCVSLQFDAVYVQFFNGWLTYSKYANSMNGSPPPLFERISDSVLGSTWGTRFQNNLLHPWPMADEGAWPPYVGIPSSLLFLSISALSGFFWYLDRRCTPPGHCRKCGYNLSGAPHERCPECGVEIQLNTDS